MGIVPFPVETAPSQTTPDGATLNDSQKQALDLTRHIAITAAAGSGKTTVLVQRFLRILETRGFRPEQIVAITFTEEAAGQMRERIREAVQARAELFKAETPEDENPWLRAARFLSLAKITTIHGFCLSLLREYPLDAGLDPDFRLLGPGEQELFLAEQVDRALDHFSRDRHPDLAALLDYVGLAALPATLRQMIRRRNHLGRLSPGRWRVEILEAAYRRETAVTTLRLPEWERLREALARLPGRLLRDTTSCARRCRRQISLFERRADHLSDEEFLTDFAESFSIRVSPSRAWKDTGHYDALKEAWDGLKKEITKRPLRLKPAPEREEAHFRRAVDALARLHSETLARFQAAKRDKGLLDFEDLLDLAGKLCRKPTVREALQRRYRFFLVDEFQDTNHVQWEILRPLLGGGSNFFAVGDSKQSIYRFRDADVTIFEQLQEWIGSRGRVLEMPENYRSLPELVRFNNQIFSGLFEKGLPFEAAHQEMRACRAGETDGRVETLFYEAEPELSEPRLTAARIRRLLDKEGRRPREIALLLRTRTRLKEYERALREADVDFETAAGVGFWQQQEIMDLLNAARFLVDPRDDVALLGALRSPLFNFSDEDLFELSRFPGEVLWEKLAAAPSTSNPRRFALETLNGWLSGRRGETVGGLLRRILRETGFAATLAASERGRQSLGNISKLLETAREFERMERHGLRRFIRFVDALEQSDAAEPEGTTPGPSLDRVRIHTIHGAKGLQFPVVVLPELGVPLASAPSDRFLAETVRHEGEACGFLGFLIRDPERGYRELSHPVFQMLRKLDLNRRLAEEKRLLYVACTRAEDHLILIGRRGDAPSPARWLIDLGAESRQIAEPDIRELTESSLRSQAPPPAATHPSCDGGAPDPWLKTDLRQAAPPTWTKNSWTATEIALWRTCPRKFFLSRIQGVGEEHPLSLEPYGGEAALVGSAVHDILEKATDLSRGSDVRRRVGIWLDRIGTLRPTASREAIEARLNAHLSAFAESGLQRRMASASRLYREKEFNVRCAKACISGVIDRLFQEPDGGWVVVDFKTNAIAAHEIPAKAAELGYDLQVEIYMWAVSRILGCEKVEGSLFFTHTGGVHPVPFDAEASARCQALIESLPLSGPADFPTTDKPSLCQSCGFLQSRLCPGTP